MLVKQHLDLSKDMAMAGDEALKDNCMQFISIPATCFHLVHWVEAHNQEFMILKSCGWICL